MAACKDCVHDEVCEKHKLLIRRIDLTKIDIDIIFSPDYCPQFKDKNNLAEVVHGKWINRKATNNPIVFDYTCSVCGRHIQTSYFREDKINLDYPSCHCGAKMDKE